MTDEQYFEDRFAQQLRSYAVAGAPSVRRDAVYQAVAAGVASRQSVPRTLRWPAFHRPMLAQAALVAIVVAASIIVVGLWASRNNQVVGPVASPSPLVSPTPPPSFEASTSPSPTTSLPALVSWTGPVRGDTAEMPVLSMLLGDDAREWDDRRDASTDWVDLTRPNLGTGFRAIQMGTRINGQAAAVGRLGQERNPRRVRLGV